MVDTHDDYREVSEFGRYFLDAVATFESSTESSTEVAASGGHLPTAGGHLPTAGGHLVNIEMIRDLVEQAMLAVEANLRADLPGATDSDAPASPQVSVQAVMRDCRARVQGFYHYLRTLPPGAAGDLLAFFPSGRLGALGRLGAVELAGKMAAIERGFSAPGNLGLANALAWRKELAAGRDALNEVLAARAEQRRAQRHSGVLAENRAYFLRVYHGLAKPAVRALLTYLGRDNEYRRFFLDLQRSEGRLALAA